MKRVDDDCGEGDGDDGDTTMTMRRFILAHSAGSLTNQPGVPAYYRVVSDQLQPVLCEKVRHCVY